MKQKYKLQTITPVHIGSGETLNHIDGYYANDKWYRIDLDKVLAHPDVDINALTSEMSRRDFRWSHYFSRHNMNAADLSTYSLLCAQSPETTDIREAIKSVGNRPYIPGSSIKGALRTALLSDLINNEENTKLKKDSSEHLHREINKGSHAYLRNESPAKKIEEMAFGKDPNHDLLRALQISDTEPVESDALAIEMAWTVTLDQNNELVQKNHNGVEVIQGMKALTFTLKIDDLLFHEREKTKLQFSKLQENTLREIADVCHSETSILMEDEQDFFDRYNLTQIADLFDKLIEANSKLPDGAFMLQIGWGTGYNANTVSSSFTQGEDAPIDMLDFRERFRLGESRSQRGHYDEREFPKTRRILYRGQNPVAPLGWVKISPVDEL